MMYMVRPLGRGHIIALVGCGKPVAAWCVSMPFFINHKLPHMKQLFLSAFVVVTLLSCSGDDNESTTQNNSILGTWQLEAGSLNDQNFTLSNCQLQNTVKFTENGRVEFTYYLGSISCHVDAVETGSWSKNNNNIKSTWDDSDSGAEVYSLDVTELSENNLKWKTNISGEGEFKETYLKQ